MPARETPILPDYVLEAQALRDAREAISRITELRPRLSRQAITKVLQADAKLSEAISICEDAMLKKYPTISNRWLKLFYGPREEMPTLREAVDDMPDQYRCDMRRIAWIRRLDEEEAEAGGTSD